MSLEDPLKRIFSIYCNVNSLDMVNLIAENLHAYDKEKVREQLKDAIENNTISPLEYEAVTGDEYATQEELIVWLKEVWNIAFGESSKN